MGTASGVVPIGVVEMVSPLSRLILKGSGCPIWFRRAMMMFALSGTNMTAFMQFYPLGKNKNVLCVRRPGI